MAISVIILILFDTIIEALHNGILSRSEFSQKSNQTDFDSKCHHDMHFNRQKYLCYFRNLFRLPTVETLLTAQFSKQ